jgi:hypothetical protein
MHLGPFRKLVRVTPTSELRRIDEVILVTVPLVATRRPRRTRDRRREAGHMLQQRGDERALPGSRRSGDDENDPVALEREIGTHVRF